MLKNFPKRANLFDVSTYESLGRVLVSIYPVASVVVSQTVKKDGFIYSALKNLDEKVKKNETI